MMEIIESIEKVIPCFMIGSDGILIECVSGKPEMANETGTYLEGGIREVTLEIRKRDPNEVRLFCRHFLRG